MAGQSQGVLAAPKRHTPSAPASRDARIAQREKSTTRTAVALTRGPASIRFRVAREADAHAARDWAVLGSLGVALTSTTFGLVAPRRLGVVGAFGVILAIASSSACSYSRP